MTGILSHNSHMTPICFLHTKKIAEAVLPYVFKMVFPASPFFVVAKMVELIVGGCVINGNYLV